jgi:hypothetical protein
MHIIMEVGIKRNIATEAIVETRGYEYRMLLLFMSEISGNLLSFVNG